MEPFKNREPAFNVFYKMEAVRFVIRIDTQCYLVLNRSIGMKVISALFRGNVVFCLGVISITHLAGCATDVANRYYSDVHYHSRPIGEVEILTKEPPRAYVVLADFQARGETAQDMRRLAAKIGADAVIVTYLGGFYNSGEEWAGHDSRNNTYSRIIGTALKYTP